MTTGLEIYLDSKSHPRLSVSRRVISRAVMALPSSLEAMALIRGAYASDSGVFATLADAKKIYFMITGVKV